MSATLKLWAIGSGIHPSVKNREQLSLGVMQGPNPSMNKRNH